MSTSALAFAFVVAVATDERVADGFAPLAVGLTVGFCALMGGPLTGASMNPARSFGPAVAGAFGGAPLWEGHWIYWLAPVTGMLAAVCLYGVLRSAEAFGAATPGDRILGAEGPI